MGLLKKVKKIAKSFAVPNLSGGVGAAIGGYAAGWPGAIAGGALGSAYDYYKKDANDKQNKKNAQAVSAANAYSKYTWDLNNAYNSPQSQVERLLAAGFNPYTQGAVSAGNSSSPAESNGIAQQNSYDRAASALQLAQMGANVASTWNSIKTGNIQRKYLDTQNKALAHNYQYAVDHDLPIGQQTGVSNVTGSLLNDIANFFKGGFKNTLDKGHNFWSTHDMRFENPYYDGHRTPRI